jgi:hypothetical protein
LIIALRFDQSCKISQKKSLTNFIEKRMKWRKYIYMLVSCDMIIFFSSRTVLSCSWIDQLRTRLEGKDSKYRNIKNVGIKVAYIMNSYVNQNHRKI